ncbi:hypothetical protein C6P78_09220 [Burkholderia multivorans]|nr:hypothetical protein C6P78_09220 [Burkholderia multivorans]
MGTSPDCAVLGCGTGASGDGGRRQRDGSIFSRSDENVFSHRARDARWREKPRRFWCGFERVLARRVAVGGNGGSAHQRARCDRRCRACDAGGRTGWRTSRAAVARLARVSAVFARALTVERHSVSTGVAGGIFTSGLVRHVAPVFALTVRLHSVSTGFFVRARWCSPFECTGFGVAGAGIYPHRDRSIRVDASDAHRSDSQTFE